MSTWWLLSAYSYEAKPVEVDKETECKIHVVKGGWYGRPRWAFKKSSSDTYFSSKGEAINELRARLNRTITNATDTLMRAQAALKELEFSEVPSDVEP